MASSLSPEKKQAYKDAFAKFDKNNDGRISKEELRVVGKMLNRDFSGADVQQMLEGLDENRSGFIEYHEFEKMMISIDEKAKGLVEQTFRQIDKDGSGFITLDEMDLLFKNLGYTLTQEEVKQQMAQVDLNKDGKISLSEFKKMMGKV